MMTERIKQLRRESLEAINTINAERALLITEFYSKHLAFGDSVPVQRAKSLQYILRNKSICINENELIVGERGPAPKATPTYPEINVHSLKDLDILNSREKVWFRVDKETRKAYEDIIIPFWKGRCNRDRIMESMSPEWLNAYRAGIFTEFMEQRAPGHTVAGYKLFQKGMLDILEDIKQSRSNIDPLNDPAAYDKLEELKAMEIAAHAIMEYAERHAQKLEDLAAVEKNDQRRRELQQMAKI
ncbi:MAG TPA: pyruvate formate lyase family protein, partial [Bacteroidales bacterium]|nr:pyruvate formate lyase family protein [Bacteroidales bacterium]